jgi:diguanylate cyclase (GGDEF)-like protein
MSVVAFRPSPPAEATTVRHLDRLLDRSAFVDHLRRAVGRADGPGGELALLAMALDPFVLTPSADTWEARAEVGIVTSSRLVGFLHHRYVPARVAGDEFLVLAEGLVDADEARELGHQLLTVAHWCDPHLFGARPLTASVGIALHEHHSSAEQLIIEADIALYRARREGGDRLQVFEPWMRDEATVPSPTA